MTSRFIYVIFAILFTTCGWKLCCLITWTGNWYLKLYVQNLCSISLSFIIFIFELSTVILLTCPRMLIIKDTKQKNNAAVPCSMQCVVLSTGAYVEIIQEGDGKNPCTDGWASVWDFALCW